MHMNELCGNATAMRATAAYNSQYRVRGHEEIARRVGCTTRDPDSSAIILLPCPRASTDTTCGSDIRGGRVLPRHPVVVESTDPNKTGDDILSEIKSNVDVIAMGVG
ncbi:unnamed protein product [Plutella xylostella]|uniref:(diamondback moth) hypothetical protein n=1 Tax=Plutella xylostella TaxID=51655 RepID=A0A8S4G727_PLUXY|nr:unnamed protein product [Plutella xylostella]